MSFTIFLFTIFTKLVISIEKVNKFFFFFVIIFFLLFYLFKFIYLFLWIKSDIQFKTNFLQISGTPYIWMAMNQIESIIRKKRIESQISLKP